MKNDKYLEGSDILLNLQELYVHDIQSQSSSSCSGPVSFYFGDTKHGCVEDPNMAGKIKVLKTEKKRDHYVLEVMFEKEEDDF